MGRSCLRERNRTEHLRSRVSESMQLRPQMSLLMYQIRTYGLITWERCCSCGLEFGDAFGKSCSKR
jgi:hypothetical protein